MQKGVSPLLHRQRRQAQGQSLRDNQCSNAPPIPAPFRRDRSNHARQVAKTPGFPFLGCLSADRAPHYNIHMSI